MINLMGKYYDFLKINHDNYYDVKDFELNPYILTRDFTSFFKENHRNKIINIVYITDKQDYMDLSELYYLQNQGYINKIEILKNGQKLKKDLFKCHYLMIFIDNELLMINNNPSIIMANNIYKDYDQYKDNLNKFKYKDIYNIIKNQTLKKLFKTILYIQKKSNIYGTRMIFNNKMFGLVNCSRGETSMLQELNYFVNVLLLPNDEKRYEYIYDLVCYKLDNRFNKYSLCDFRESKCVCLRECKVKKPLIYGCCYTNGRVCKYLKDSHCTIECLPCKLFTCRTLKRIGVKYKVNDFILLDIFFNYKQKVILDESLFTPKLDMIYKLINNK